MLNISERVQDEIFESELFQSYLDIKLFIMRWLEISNITPAVTLLH